MKNIQNLKTEGGLGIKAPKKKILETFTCEGCNQEVKRTEMEIPGGPKKGETFIADIGCKCEDLELLRQINERNKRNKNKKLLRSFDYYSLINKSLHKATLANYEPTSQQLAQAKYAVSEYIENFDGTGNLLLSGSYGTGKSHLSVSATKELMEKGYECLFLSLPKLLTKIKDTYNDNKVSEDELLEVIQRVDLLVLDDIGAEHHNKRDGEDWANAKLFEVLDGRAGKATIYTTNLSSDQLEAKINERNFSRMMEDTKVIKMDGKDYRRKQF